jgi:hypothetical protein
MKIDNCIECGKKTTSYVNILTGLGWKYESYCLNCARAFFGKNMKQSCMKANLQQLNQLSYQYDLYLQQATKSIISEGIDMDNVPVHYKKFLIRDKFESQIPTEER